MKRTVKNKVARLAKLCLVIVTTVALLASTTSFAYAAVGDTNVVPDPQLQAYLNANKFTPARPATTPISAAELANMTGNISPGASYPGITSFEGLQYAKQIGSVTFAEVTISDLTPLGQMSEVNSINIQSYTTPSGVVDLTPLTPLANDLIILRFNNSSYDVATTQIIGLGTFTNLTSLSLNYSALSDLPGLSSLTKLSMLYLNGNNFGNDIIAQLPSTTFSILNLSYNHISDFSGVPTASQRYLGGQDVLGSDVLLASADQDTFTADPADRPISPTGGPASTASGADTGPITFDATDLYRDTDLSSWGMDLSSVPAFTDFTYYEWYVDSSDWSYSFYPVATVDMNDDAGLSYPTDTTLDEALATFSYSVDDPSVPTFTPVSYALESGTLPTGITLDPTTGRLVGTTSEEGAFEFTISATDANGLMVIGSFTATFEKAAEPPVESPVEETKPPVVSETASPTAKPKSEPLLALPQTGDTQGGTVAVALAFSGGVLAVMIVGLRRSKRQIKRS
ncbi:MAG: putative Ig domain-containing protein [Actinomycetia bacterium]|nr:putative Ig domain-containing protein [Actinomycetes bacterium]